jgi:hypothetical protein
VRTSVDASVVLEPPDELHAAVIRAIEAQANRGLIFARGSQGTVADHDEPDFVAQVSFPLEIWDAW